MDTRRVMIVEDESLVAEDLRSCIVRFGWEVVGVADTAATAREIVRSGTPDLALLDIRLKGTEDGIDLASDLRRADIGFVYLTSHADQTTLARAGSTAPLGYVLKPFDARELFPVLEMAFYRHAADRRQRTMERWLAITLRSIGDGVLATDLQLKVTYMNPAAETILGVACGDAVGRPIADVLLLAATGAGVAPRNIAARAIEEEAIVYLEAGVEVVRGDGSRVPIDDCAAPVRDETGAVSGAVVVFRDATERLRMVQRQREADLRLQDARHRESLAVLAGGLAHDLNNMLTVILGNVDFCRHASPPDLLAPLDTIAQSAQAAANLCRRMLEGAGRGPIARRPLDTAKVIDDAVRLEAARAVPGVRIEVQGDRPRVAVLADPVQIGQVLANLLRNAVEAFGPRGGTIAVRHGPLRLPSGHDPAAAFARHLPPGDYVWIEVSDDGPGMPADVRQRVFEPFFTTKFTGRGLGLASVHGIVSQHGGAIDVVSEPGLGTSFRIAWPAAPTPPPA